MDAYLQNQDLVMVNTMNEKIQRARSKALSVIKKQMKH